ncbi:MAG TPA: tripartite tricarboxylate transporter substrate-binding protein, partial [Xanthobacteraceae bacterium]|nr:tripartite tricarboxylate transporter substrate-binding protein [Xanthobacteraceae bacterium]
MTIRSLLVKTAAALLALTTLIPAVPAAAQQYPTKPIRMIIPFPPGGSNDVVGRLISAQLGEKLGRQIIVDNRSGAGGVIGTELASQAPKDGYTLAVISIAHAVNPWLYDLKGRYDPIKSFTPIAALGSGPNVLVVNPNYAAKNVKEL